MTTGIVLLYGVIYIHIWDPLLKSQNIHMYCKYVEQSLAKTELNFDSIVQTFEAPLSLMERIFPHSIVIDSAE